MTATGINGANLVSGFFTNAAGNTLGFLENLNGTGLKTFEFPGSTNTMFLGVNNTGEAVGSYLDAAGTTHGLLYNILTGVGTSIDVPNSVNETVLNGLNDRGQYVGFYMDAAGNTHGVLVAVPEPSSVLLMVVGVMGYPVLRNRVRRSL